MILLRCKFKKVDDICYISHLETMKTIERALRRANINLSFSQGFNPHPKMAFAQALSLGLESYGEYMDVEVEDDLDEEEFINKLNEQMPMGLVFIKAKKFKEKTKSLMSIVSHSRYIIEIKNIETKDIKSKIDKYMKQDEIIITKKTKKGKLKEIDIKKRIYSIDIVDIKDDSLVLNTILQCSSEGNLKPSIFVSNMMEYLNLNEEYKMDVNRIDLYKNEDGKIMPILD